MFRFFVVQLPFSVCATWYLLVLFKRHKNHSNRLMIFIMAFLAIFFLCGSSYMSPIPNYRRLVIYDIVMQFTSLAVFPLICFYIRSLYEESHEGLFSYMLLLPAFLMTTSSIVVTSLLGMDECSEMVMAIHKGVLVPDYMDVLEKAYTVMSYRAYRFVFFGSMALSLIYLFSRLFTGKFRFSHIPAFWSGKRPSFVANAVCLLFVVFFILWILCTFFMSVFMNPFSVWSWFWAVFASATLFFIGYVAAVPPLPGGYIDLHRFMHPFVSMSQSRQEFISSIDSGPVADRTTGYDKIMDSFQDLMVKHEGFLEPGMTIDEISKRLNSNRTYVSKLVNIYYGMPFRDYLSDMRINYAKKLMMAEPDASLDYISAKSGFQSSTQFIRKFKELEGVTPAVWRSSQRKK